MSDLEEEQNQLNEQRVSKRRRASSNLTEPLPEEEWNSDVKVRRHEQINNSKFVLITSVAVLSILIAAAVVVLKLSKQDQGIAGETGIELTKFIPPEQTPELSLSLDPSDPKTWFEERSGELSYMATEILEKMSMSDSDATLSALLRFPEVSMPYLNQWPSILEPLPDFENYKNWGVSIEKRDDTAYLVFKGKRKDYTDCLFFFVREGEELKLDWMASAAYSDSRISSHIETPFTRPTLVRGIVSKPQIYLGPYGDDKKWSSFEIADPLGGESLWAYAEKESDIEKELFDWMDYGRFVVDLTENVRGTFVVKSPDAPGAHRKQVEIVKVVQKDWLTP